MSAPEKLADGHIFDTRRKRRQRARAARRFHDHAFLHARVAEDIADRLETVNRAFERTLIFGDAGLLAREAAARPGLADKLGFIIHADSTAALTEAPGIVFDPEALPIAEGSLDCVISILSLHWANDLPGALIQIRRALKPDGLFIGAILGGETLASLRLSLFAAEDAVTGGAAMRVAPCADVRDGAGLLQRAGFALPVADADRVRVRYANPLRLLQDLRGMGETAAFAAPAPALRREVLARALADYAEREAEPDGRVGAVFEVITLTGWAPHSSQPKPLRPGTAKARLADALGVPEQSAGEKAQR